MGFINNLIRNITKKTLTGENRQDKQFQSDFQDAVDKGKKVSVNDVKSSRWDYNSKGNNDYTSNDIADIDNDEYDARDINDKLYEHSVSSTAVDSFDYDPKTGDLDIKFRGGNKKYTYPDVPPEVVKEFMDAPSKGKYVNNVIGPEYAV